MQYLVAHCINLAGVLAALYRIHKVDIFDVVIEFRLVQKQQVDIVGRVLKEKGKL